MGLYLRGPTNENLIDVYWARVISPPPSGASWRYGKAGNLGPAVTLKGMQTLVAYEYKYNDDKSQQQRIKRVPFHLQITGTVEIEYAHDEHEPFPGPIASSGGPSPTTDGTRASVVESVSDVGAVSTPAIYDVTSAVNTALDPGSLDMTAYRQASIIWSCSAGTSTVTVKEQDDTPTDWPSATLLAAPAAAIQGRIAIGPGCAGAGGVTLGVSYPLPHRIHPQAGTAGVGNTVRLRIEGRR